VGFGTEPRGVAGLSPRGMGFFDDFETLEFAISSRNLLESIQPLLQPVLRSIRVFVDDRHGLVSYGRYHPESLQMLQVQVQDTDSAIVHFILDRLINDPYASDALLRPKKPLDKLFKAALEYVLFHGTQHFSILLEIVPAQFSRPLEQALFCSAVQLDAAEAVAALLSRKMGPNEPYRFGSGETCVPLRWACIYRRFKVATILLHHGADPNECNAFSLLYGNPSFRSPLPVASDFIRILIISGAKLEAQDACHIFRHCPLDVLTALAENAVDDTFDIFIEGEALLHLILRTDWEHELLPVIRTVLQKRDHSRQYYRAEKWKTKLISCLQCAALRGRKKVIDLLFAAGARADTECLICAAHSKKTDVFLFFLDLGLDPNACSNIGVFDSLNPDPGLKSARWSDVLSGTICVYDGDYENNRRSINAATALSTCIRERFQGAIDILVQRSHLTQATNRQNSTVQAHLAACIVGDIDMIRLLQDGADPWCLEHNGPKAMTQAIKSSQSAAVHELLRVGIKADNSSLLAAVQGGHTELFTLLRTRMTAAPRDKWLYDETLIGAILRGYHDFVKNLLEDEGCSAIGMVFLKKYDHRLLISSLDPSSLDGFVHIFSTPLSCAILMKNEELISLLSISGVRTPLRSGRSVFGPGSDLYGEDPYFPPTEEPFLMTPLAACALINDPTRVRELLDLGADACDDFAIYGATVSGQQRVLKVLLDSCRLIRSERPALLGKQALLWSIRNHAMQMLKVLAEFVTPGELTKPAVGYVPEDALKGSDSPFLEAVRLHCERGDDDQALRVLLPFMKDLDFIACKGGDWADTPLTYAIKFRSFRTISILIEEGRASPSLPCRWGCERTPLQAAAEAGCLEIVDYLLERGVQADETPANHAGGTALQLAAIQGQLGVAAKLLAVHADVNAEPAKFDGRTAFEGATEHGRVDMMLLLFKNGADLISDNWGQYRRAVEFAKENAQYAAIELAERLLKEAMRKDEEDRVSFENLLDFEMGDIGGYPIGG
jgi:ankyrin repeat protein